MRLYAGGFYRTANNVESISGVQGRLQISRSGWFGVQAISSSFAARIRYQSDTNYPIGALLFRFDFPLVKYWEAGSMDTYNALTPVEHRMTERVRRPLSIHNGTRRFP